ncbi:MAG: SDR family NAD(P)-dependent oxidoreductase [Verrucomicrobia bacterium]|nr:SDR family NAD(P)-dependent oxidoreductase [Verrucomicrobiota bacterium]
MALRRSGVRIPMAPHRNRENSWPFGFPLPRSTGTIPIPTVKFSNPAMKGKVVVITGATRGIGRAGALRCAGMNALLLLVGRSVPRLHEIAGACQRAGAEKVRVFRADLTLRKEVESLAKKLAQAESRVDVLWNNAGGYFTERRVTPEGYERTWAMNHLAYMDLTQGLLPLLLQSRDPRVICTASEAHRWGRMRWDNLQGEKRWDGWKAYCNSKLANLLYVAEQARRLGKSKIRICAVHPGLVNSSLGDENAGVTGWAFLWLKRLFGKTNEQGADTAVWVATRTERPKPGGYYAYRQEKMSSPLARNRADAKKLWEISQKRS